MTNTVNRRRSPATTVDLDTDTPTGPLDLVWGAAAIAALIGRSERSTFYILENGELPARKVFGRWVVERETLVRFFGGEAA